MLETPLIIVNFKTYPEATGGRALELAKIIERVAIERAAKLAAAPQYADIFRIASQVSIPVLAQHADPISPGRNTGWISLDSIKAAGAVGTLINHSEHKIPLPQIERVISLAKKSGLTTVACTADIEESKKIAKIDPDLIAVEPPELIATGISVSKAKPEVVSGSVKAIKEVNPRIRILCGAGITTGEDVRRAIELGTEGVLVASGVVRAKDQRASIEDMVDGMLGEK